jgi:hypothetical protein
LLQGIGTERQRAVINYAFVQFCVKRNIDPSSVESLRLANNLYMDVSQSIGRQSAVEHIPAIASSTLVYSYRLDRCILPEELMQVYGFPAPRETGLTPAALKDLVSECMALPSLGVAVLALLGALGTRLPGLWPQIEQAC